MAPIVHVLVEQVRKGDQILMKRLAGALTGTLLLALAASGGASADPKVGSCPPKAGSPFELFPVSSFPTVDIDLNQNGFVCAFNLPQDPRLFQIIDDVAQVP
jgi:hypothetical protein